MDYRDFNIDIRSSKTSGEVVCLCPECSHTRKKKTDKCLSVNLDKNTWLCHHCGWKGGLTNRIEDVVYIKPKQINNTTLSDKAVKWFESRKISQSTLIEMKVSEGLEWMPQDNKEVNTIQFNFFRNNELINVKYRTVNKHFKLHKGSELIFYNLSSILGHTEIIITEGEMDALSFVEAGFKNVVSVPNGANLNTNNLTYIDNCIELFEGLETIYLATDNDIAGRKLRQELADRFGVERCKYLEFDEFKDANDLLIHKGNLAIKESIDNAKSFPLEGVFTISDIDLEINDIYENGLDNGVRTGMFDLDEKIRFVKGYITTFTGIPGHGKSDFVDQVALKLNISNGWKFAFYSPENRPTRLHFTKLARKLIGKAWFGQEKMSFAEVIKVKEYLNNKFWFIKPEKDFTLDSILKHVKTLKIKFGIDAFVIDAWNKLEHKYSQSETKYIGESLDKIAIFCEENNVHCFLVAHPTKTQKRKDSALFEIPNLYSISGSSNFYNKTDNGITIYRNYETNTTEIYVQKVKFSHWGEVGMIEYKYEKQSGRFVQNPNDAQADWIKTQGEKEERNFKVIPLTSSEDAFGNEYKPNLEIPF